MVRGLIRARRKELRNSSSWRTDVGLSVGLVRLQAFQSMEHAGCMELAVEQEQAVEQELAVEQE
jgi:hypothetical protein